MNYLEKYSDAVTLAQDIHRDEDDSRLDFGVLGTIETMLKNFTEGSMSANTLKQLLLTEIDL
jgi:hypothetical protein